MSHGKERMEKECLNCGSLVAGRYCQNCGQENIEPHESLPHLVKDFAFDLFHFDGKFFITLKDLFLKPGFLTREYILGRRMKYLHPIRMYIFTSAIFFLIYFSFINHQKSLTPAEIAHLAVTTTAENLKDSIAEYPDKPKHENFLEAYNSLQKVYTTIPVLDTAEINRSKLRPGTIAEYDSLQALLDEGKTDNFIEQILIKKEIERGGSGGLVREELEKDFKEHFWKSIPQMLFITLPLLALFLKLLYISKKHKEYYVDHLIFLVHVYIAIFLLTLVEYGFDGLYTWTGFGLFYWLSFITKIGELIYPFLAMYNFYKQSFFKTLAKYLILFFASSIAIVALMLALAWITYMRL